MGSRTGMRGTRAAWVAAAVVAGAITVGTGAGGVSGQEVPGEPAGAPAAVDTQAGPAYETDSFQGLHGVVDGDAASVVAGDAGPKSPEADTVDMGALPAGGVATAGDKVDVPGEGGAAGAAALSEADEPTVIPAPVGGGDSAADLRAAVAGEATAGDLASASTPDTTRVIVYMNQDIQTEGTMSAAAVADQRAAIAASLGGLGDLLAGTGSAVVDPYEVIPAAAVEVDAAGLEALLASDAVAAVTLDREFDPALDVSTGIIDSDLLNAAGVLGDGYNGEPVGRYEVVVLDTGVRSTHDAFGSRVVDGFCYSNASWCPNGGTSQFGVAAGAFCTYSTGSNASECQHGTHVAGIAAGASWAGPGFTGHEGVARGAGIIAGQIGNRSCSSPNYCWRYTTTNLDNGLQRTINLKNGPRPDIAAVNMSIGGSLYSTEAACGAAIPSTEALMVQLDSLQIAPVVAAGNNYSTTQVTYPSCLPSAYTISATTDTDAVASFSNRNAITDWWAPGSGIVAPISTSDTARGSKSGTSMAAPHVAGAFALLRECIPVSTDESVANLLSSTGVNITSPAGVTRKRINVLDAATSTVNNNDFGSAEVFNGDGPFNDYDWNVCADSEPGEPNAAPGFGNTENSIWWNWTPATSGVATISTNDGGGNTTTFDTVLHVFQGNSVGALNLLAYDDDSGVGLRSLVTMLVTGGQTYRIRVDGYAASNGELNLHIENNVAECRGVPATIIGTTGNDVFSATGGDDVIVTGDGNDVVNGLGGNDRICLGAGNDVGRGGTGNDLVDGESGNDTVIGQAGDDFMYGGPGSDTVRGGTNNDIVVGNAGGGDTNDLGDTLYGDDGNDTIDGWVGNDVMYGGRGNDAFFGAAGVDTVRYFGWTNGVIVNLTAGTASGEGSDTLNGVEYIDGTNQRDILTGDGARNRFRGYGGNDAFSGEGGNDLIYGGDGNDVMRGELGNDLLNGGTGTDTVTFIGVPGAGVRAKLTTGTATGQGSDTLVGIENLFGSAFNDVLVGDDGPNLIRGGDGNDVIVGKAGNDNLQGQNGNDMMRGEQGNDTFNGGNGSDRVSFLGVGAGVVANLLTGTATGQGNDTITKVEKLDGSNLADVLLGDHAANVLRGENGNDLIRGRGGNDQLWGGPGNDTLIGEGGFDNCNGQGGIDAAGGCEVLLNIP